MRSGVRLHLPGFAFDAADCRRRGRRRTDRERHLAGRARGRFPRTRPRPRHRPARRADLHVGNRGGQLPASRDRGLAGRRPPRGHHRGPAARTDRRRRQPGDPATGDLRRLSALVIHPARPRCGDQRTPGALHRRSGAAPRARTAGRAGAHPENRWNLSARSRGPPTFHGAGGRAPDRSRYTRDPTQLRMRGTSNRSLRPSRRRGAGWS